MQIELRSWAELYDTLRYPVSIYEELVVEQQPFEHRFAVMGAWKTGSISTSSEVTAYTDKSGRDFFYSNRWKKETPVGFHIWNDLAKRDAEIVQRVPSELGNKNPDLVKLLCKRKGFGLIWSVFVLHCVRPEVFPLYDQHVYRAYRWLATDGIECPNSAPASWPEYKAYADWFKGVVVEHPMSYWIVDRGLWTFGKSLKRPAKGASLPRVALPILDELNDEWAHETTFGGKAKAFWWKIDGTGSISIKRRFKSSVTGQLKEISADEIALLQEFMSDQQWHRLSNNVAKLRDLTEQPGIGRFLVDNLGWSFTDAQLAGHLGVILTNCGVWDYNEKKSRIQHRRMQKSWKKPLSDYYRQCIAEIGE